MNQKSSDHGLKEATGLLLGVNIDHVATLRNARGKRMSDVILRAAHDVIEAGAQTVTIHLREDRRHIVDTDVEALIAGVAVPINLEIAATDEMLAIALKQRPAAVCIVPERRQELTTEGGLDVLRVQGLEKFIAELKKARIRVSLFVDPTARQIEAASALSADAIELHTGRYAEATMVSERNTIVADIAAAAELAERYGLQCHAGHGLTVDNVAPIAAISKICELHIGYSIVMDSIFDGLSTATHRMVEAIRLGRGSLERSSVK